MKKKYETKIKDYTKDIEQNINQEAVLQTIKKCKKTFVQAEDYPLSYMEFLYDQMQFIQKRWWILQGCLLVVLWIFLNDAADIYEIPMILGKGPGTLFLTAAGLSIGVFVGCLAMSLAETLKALPAMSRRIGLAAGLQYLILGIAAGKFAGAWIYFWKGLAIS